MPAVLIQQPDLPKTVRMTLTQDNFGADGLAHRIRAGTVVLTDEVTAERWRQLGIAVDAAETDKTLMEQKRAELERLSAELAALESGGESEPSPPTASGRGRARP